SVEFNHCIALLTLNGKEYYLDLTDSNLPFGSLPQNLYGAASLVIPAQAQKTTVAELKPLMSPNRNKDRLIKNVTVTVGDKDLKFAIASVFTGNITSSIREHYSTLSADKQKEDWEQAIAGMYKNGVKLETLSFKGLQDLEDSITATYNYSAKSEVVEAGSMRMIKLPVLDVIASLDNFSADKREHPIEYWNFENSDLYQSSITINLTGGRKFLEVPANQTFTFNNCSYSITYTRLGEALKIERTAKLQRDNIKPVDYEKFKLFFSNIVEAESKFIVFK
ncbi:MAG: hypothetical protein ICV84_03240, partial [Flavisolibacter sp.]|nr:hypothetical protein [Flavisolibacter sp.]